MEAAVDAFARRVGAPVEERIATDQEMRRFAFDPRRRRSSVLTRGEVLVKGAPDSVLREVHLGSGGRCHARNRGAHGAGAAGAGGGPPSVEGVAPSDATEAEDGLELLGVLALEDPPRPSAPERWRPAGWRGSSWR